MTFNHKPKHYGGVQLPDIQCIESRRVKKGDCSHSIQNAGQYCGNLLRAKGQHNVNYTATFCDPAWAFFNAESIEGRGQKMSSPHGTLFD